MIGQSMNDSSAQKHLRSFLGSGASDASIRRLRGGEVNGTWLVVHKNKKYILQRLSSVFGHTVIDDMEIITTELRRDLWIMPTLIKTLGSHRNYVEDYHDPTFTWRLMTFIESDGSIPEVGNNLLSSMGLILARLHRSLSAIDYEPTFRLAHYRDTSYHLIKLRRLSKLMSIESDVSMTTKILEAWRSTPTLPRGKRQLIHGDPRMANMLFMDKMPFTFIDWDTVMKGTVWMDIGDMIRSLVEASLVPANNFRLDKSALTRVCAGYFEELPKNGTLDRFIHSALDAAGLISLELAARFMNDIVEDYYWSWDTTKFVCRADNNRSRANETWRVYERICKLKGELDD